MRNRSRGLVLAFSLAYTMMLPLQVSAAEAELHREETIVAADEAAYRELAEEALPGRIKENGRTYERTEIRYEIIGTNYLDKKEKTLELQEKPEKTHTEDGVTYHLETSELEEKTVREEAVQMVTAYDDYDTYVTAADVPGTKTVTAVNDATGEQESVTCSFTGITRAGTTTVDNVMTITFSNYDAAYYEWNGNYIAHNDQMPPIAGYEVQLLAQAGVDDGEIIDCYYTGDPYTVDGVVYRDAAATVRQRVQVYRANYTGTITTPTETETVYKAVYSTPDLEGDVELTVRASADYVAVSILPYIFAGAGILVVAALIIIILIILSKKKKEQEKL